MGQLKNLSKSHPVIRFQQIPIVPGRLFELESFRDSLLDKVTDKTQKELAEQFPNYEELLQEALYLERQRLRKQKFNFFTARRRKADRALWKRVRQDLMKPPAESDRQKLLEQIIRHYAEEVGGHFDSRVYQWAIRAVPWGFSWLLNAASVKRFLPWGMTQSLQSRLHIVGEVPALQKLIQKGTILLVPTHQSHIDSVLIGYVIYLMSLPPFAYGAGLNLFSNPLLSFFMSRLGSYTVDRQKQDPIYKQTLKSYSTLLLKEGVHSIFYPGGGRSRSGAIESKVKLGLLGTALEAQIQNHLENHEKPNLYIVPMVTSYHCVLEAPSLIENFLSESGRHRMILKEDEAWQPIQVLRFFWKFFSTETAITARIGKPMDVFGNFVDEDGNSLSAQGTQIDSSRWLVSRNELKREPQRDHEYTRELGARLADRFHKENTVLTSHVAAFVYFEYLRQRYPDFDLFRFLRLDASQRLVPWSDYLNFAQRVYQRLVQLSDQGSLYLSEELRVLSVEEWLKDGISQLGFLHDTPVLKLNQELVSTQDLKVVYYYRNRLSGYGLSFRANTFDTSTGEYDSQGFLV